MPNLFFDASNSAKNEDCGCSEDKIVNTGIKPVKVKNT